EVEMGRSEALDQRRGLTSELDEMWSDVRSKAHPRWLWHALDHHSGPYEPRALDADRRPFFSSCKRCWSRLASRTITRMGGELTSGTLTPKSLELARKTPRKSRANPSICGPGSHGWCAAPSVLPKRSTGTIWSLGCASIAMNLDEPYEIG